MNRVEADAANGHKRGRPFESGRVFRLSGWQWLVFWPANWFLRLYLASLRLRMRPEEAALLAGVPAPRVLVTWHNRSLLAPEIGRRFLPPRSGACLISPSRVAAWQVAFYERVGIEVVRGSSSRRGIAAMRELVRVLRSGLDAAISPDGPSGPLYEIKRGAVRLARMTRSPVMLIIPNARWAIRLRTWDRHLVPLPFSRVEVRVRRVRVDPDLPENEETAAWAAALREITED